MVIDFFGLGVEEVRQRFPAAYQYLLDRAKPERDLNRNAIFQRLWWVIGHPRPQFRAATAGLHRYFVTVETAKHRLFASLDCSIVPDSTLVTFALEDGASLGILLSVTHVEWSLAAGGTLEDRPRYNKTRCFETFPFPHTDTGLTPDLSARIRALAEQLDAHRKTQQAAHPDLTLTGMYNVLDKLRNGQALNAKDKLIHTQGLVSVLKSLHDDLDAAVLAAYGWSDLQSALTTHTHTHIQAEARDTRAAAVETLLERLVALNAQRAAEEATGHVRWLRPDFQQRGSGVQAGIDVTTDTTDSDAPTDPTDPTPPAPAVHKRAWPTGLPEQIKAVADLLATSPAALSLAEIEARFSARGRWRDRLPTILDTLEALGRARRPDAGGSSWQGA